MVEDLVDSLMEVEMIIKRTSDLNNRDQRGRGIGLEEEASMEIVYTTMKKGIKHLNVLNAKEGMLEEMNGRQSYNC